MTEALPERFWSKVSKTETCWLWTAATSHGYGVFWLGRLQKAHRLAYADAVGPIPDGLDLDHLCRVTRCVNPAHLQPVTRGENVLRGEGSSAQRARQTQCKNGHAFDSTNTYVRKNGQRRCRTCHAITERRRRAS